MGMSSFRLATACTAGLAMLASTFAAAQATSRSDPSNPKAEVLPLGYESPLKGYRKFEDQPVTSWRGANELAHKLGGWKAFASGQVPDVPEDPAAGPTPAKPAPPQAPAPGGGHAGHKTK